MGIAAVGKDKPKAPPAPDPYATAAAQTASNKETAIANANLNRIDQNTPWGSIKYTVTGNNADGTPRYQQDMTLSPDQQYLLDAEGQQNRQINDIASGYMSRIKSTMGQGLDTSGLPAMQGSVGNTGQVQTGLDFSGAPKLPGVDDFSADRKRIEDALYARINPEFDRQEGDLRNRLANQGIMQGSEAYTRELDTLNRARTDARNQVVAAGGQEQSRLFGLGMSARQQSVGETAQQGEFGNTAQAQRYAQALTGANLANSTRSQGLQEAAYLRDRPLNEFNALRSASPLQAPQFQGVDQVGMAGTDIGSLINQNYGQKMNGYNQKMAAYNNMISGLFSLGSSAAMAASDRRLKRDIERIGTTPGGLPVYEYEYVWGGGRTTGVIADEVEKIIPSAVFYFPDGYARVDYAQVR